MSTRTQNVAVLAILFSTVGCAADEPPCLLTAENHEASLAALASGQASERDAAEASLLRAGAALDPILEERAFGSDARATPEVTGRLRRIYLARLVREPVTDWARVGRFLDAYVPPDGAVRGHPGIVVRAGSAEDLALLHRTSAEAIADLLHRVDDPDRTGSGMDAESRRQVLRLRGLLLSWVNGIGRNHAPEGAQVPSMEICDLAKFLPGDRVGQVMGDLAGVQR